jgi:hypothetical protein
MSIYMGGRIMKIIERKGEGASMYFDELIVVRQFLQIPPDSIFRDIQIQAKTG